MRLPMLSLLAATLVAPAAFAQAVTITPAPATPIPAPTPASNLLPTTIPSTSIPAPTTTTTTVLPAATVTAPAPATLVTVPAAPATPSVTPPTVMPPTLAIPEAAKTPEKPAEPAEAKPKPKTALDRRFDDMDLNHDGMISREEWAAANKNKAEERKPKNPGWVRPAQTEPTTPPATMGSPALLSPGR